MEFKKREDWGLGDKVRCLVTTKVATIIEIEGGTIRVEWPDHTSSCLKKTEFTFVESYRDPKDWLIRKLQAELGDCELTPVGVDNNGGSMTVRGHSGAISSLITKLERLETLERKMQAIVDRCNIEQEYGTHSGYGRAYYLAEALLHIINKDQ